MHVLCGPSDNFCPNRQIIHQPKQQEQAGARISMIILGLLSKA